jgi:hypothetical protein
MKTKLLTLTALLLVGAAAQAQDSLLNYLAQACEADKAKYCSQVTPGDPQKMLACAYAHQDKLSGECSYALYRAANAMEQMAAALSYLAESCEGDIEILCSNVRAGEGRILACLNENASDISPSCSKALKETVAGQ